jgi:predicted enzyme related to lactoylglutathione lyase
MTPDVAVAQQFYGAVVGWTFQDTDDEFGGYTIAEARGAAAAGIGPLQPGAPTAWTMYLASDDADKTAAAVTENGGTLLLEPGDVGDLGRMFVAIDPTGAAFGVWQAGTHIGASLVNEPGGLNWEDLRSPDPDAARAFYSAVFGYETRPIGDEDPDYTTFHLPGDGIPLGGIGGMEMMGSAAAEIPPHWVVYFAVADADAAVAAAREGGGAVLADPFDTPYGRMGGLLDPGGASFWIMQNRDGAGPDRDG